MRRKIAHLKWGLPQRILESHLLFHLLGPCPLPLVEVRLLGLYLAWELQEKHWEAQGSRPGLKCPERFQRAHPLERKSSKLPTQAQTLEKCGPHRWEPMGGSVHPEEAQRVRPPGGPGELQVVQEKFPTGAKLPAPRKPAAESRSWCVQGSKSLPVSTVGAGKWSGQESPRWQTELPAK